MPGCRVPVKLTRMVFGLRTISDCVASSRSISVVPTPQAQAPNPPLVAVWLSPQAMVLPGKVSPISGAMT